MTKPAPLISLLGISLASVLFAPLPCAAAPPVEQYAPARLSYDGPKPPWPRRRRPQDRARISAHGLIDLSRWPPEPAAPAEIDLERFAAALRTLCAEWMPPGRPRQYAEWISRYGRQFGVDPFLLAAVVYRHSRCLPQKKTDFGVGLTKIDPKMHAGAIKRGRYRYQVLEQGRFVPRELDVSRFAFVEGNLRRAEPNIYFGAALLAVAQAQCPKNDGAFGSVPHRHFVSHVIWGDRVKGARAEDRVLRARRRLLEYYSGQLPPPRGRFGDLALHFPLDGAPRVATSVMGEDRNNGKRPHRGLDFASTYGEPVRAVAAGTVVLAGLDRKQGGPINLAPDQTRALRRAQMGPGGLFVMIQHAEGLRSAYMHLASYTVRHGQKVQGGEIIGSVGRSGVRDSGAHLHFELRHGGKHLDPFPALSPYLIPPQETYLGRFVAAEQKRQRRLRRLKRWRQRKAAQQTATSAPGSMAP